MNVPGLVRRLRDSQVEHGAGHRQRRYLAIASAVTWPTPWLACLADGGTP
jgi:hypothetical protein